MTHAGLLRCGNSRPDPLPLPVTDALLLPLFTAVCRFPVTVPAFPLRPPSRLFAALPAAIARHRMRRQKTGIASLQQTPPAPRRPRSTFPLLLGFLGFLGILISLTT